MARSRLHSRFQLVESVRPFPSPWGDGTVYLIRPLDCREYQAILLEERNKNPLLVEIGVAKNKATLKMHLANQAGAWLKRTAFTVGDMVRSFDEDNPSPYLFECTKAGVSGKEAPEWPEEEGAHVVDGGVVWTARATQSPRAIVTKALEEAIDRAVLTDAQLMSMAAGDGLKGVLALLAGWHSMPGDDGTEVPYDAEGARALFEDDRWVPAGLAFGGQTLGEAMQAFVLASAKEAMDARSAYLEEAGPNSGRSSAGELNAGPSSTT